MKVLTRFLLSATSAEQFPAPGPPEIAFLGRSNVGKSSVINSLLGSRVARTSSTPGRTRTINFYEIRHPGNPRPWFVFADLPGYGYAKVPRELSAEWPQFIEPYLLDRAPLSLCLALVDLNVPPQASDLQLMEWLQAKQRPFVVVATKADKLSGNQRANSRRALEKAFQTDAILPYSARTGDGRQELWQRIRESAKLREAG
ncbi:MAG TPA: ribosome biogenesis GTP-binding protein YihA/YsxC [Terriglobales bacterium]|nr:ribosome biogenesis GTP-binding protein YihA/YsxC [Terriglobales bacterium]